MKHLFYLLLAFTLISPTLLSCGSDDGQEVVMVDENTDSVAYIVNKLTNCSKIYTAEVQMHKVFIAEDPMKLGGDIVGININIDLPLGDRKIAIPMSATVKAYVDFSEFSKKNVKIDGNDIIIELPEPQIVLTSSEIDHDEVKTDISIFRSKFSDKEITEFSKKGRAEIIKAAPKSGVIEKAEAGAAAVIVPMLTQLGYKDKNIQVVFNKNVTSDPISFIKKKLIVK